jgi:uncharacterized membrane protein
MGSLTALFIFSILHGSAKALGKIIAGADISEILTSFTGTLFIGTAVTWAVVWIVLKLSGKEALAITVTNWILAAAAIVSLSLAIIRM